MHTKKAREDKSYNEGVNYDPRLCDEANDLKKKEDVEKDKTKIEEKNHDRQ